MNTNLRSKSIVGLIAVVIYLILPFVTKNAYAVPLDQAMLRFDRLAVGVTDVDILVMLEPTGTANEDFVVVDFDSDFSVDSTASNITATTTGIPGTCTALNVGAAATSVSSQEVKFTISSPADPATGTLYCFIITAGIDNPAASTGSQTHTIRTEDSGSAEIESTSVVTYSLSAGGDQVTITATVPPTFTFALSGNTDSFTTDLSTSAVVSTNGIDGTVVTNAANGWTAYVESANAALDSTVTGDTITTTGSVDGSPSTLSSGTEGYVLDVDEDTDPQTNGSISAEYNGTTTSAGGTLSDTALQPIATGTAPTAGYVFTLIGRAAISGLTQAASDYTDTWTVVAAGNF